MKCPRCGGDMSSGVCDNCGFPVTRRIVYPKPKTNLSTGTRYDQMGMMRRDMDR